VADAAGGKAATTESSALCGDPARPSSSAADRCDPAPEHPRLVAPPESIREFGEGAGDAGRTLRFRKEAEEREHGPGLEDDRPSGRS
jgi:hypothetical protein